MKKEQRVELTRGQCPYCKSTLIIEIQYYGACSQCDSAWHTTPRGNHYAVDYGTIIDYAIREAEWTDNLKEAFGLNNVRGLFPSEDCPDCGFRLGCCVCM